MVIDCVLTRRRNSAQARRVRHCHARGHVLPHHLECPRGDEAIEWGRWGLWKSFETRSFDTGTVCSFRCLPSSLSRGSLSPFTFPPLLYSLRLSKPEGVYVSSRRQLSTQFWLELYARTHRLRSKFKRHRNPVTLSQRK